MCLLEWKSRSAGDVIARHILSRVARLVSKVHTARRRVSTVIALAVATQLNMAWHDGLTLFRIHFAVDSIDLGNP